MSNLNTNMLLWEYEEQNDFERSSSSKNTAFFWVLMLLYISSVLLRVRVVIAQSLRYVRARALLVQK